MSRHRSVAVVTLLLLTGLVTLDVLTDGPLRRNLDPAGQLWVRAHAHGGGRLLARALLQAGQRYVLIGPLVVLAALVAWRQRSWRPVLVGIGVLVGVAAAGAALKLATGRTAPSSGHDTVLAGASSFPSGHAINGIILWGLALSYLAALIPGVTARRRSVIAAATGIAAGLGTVGMGYHWVTDALGGWLLGAAGYLLVTALEPARGASPRPPQPEPVAQVRSGSTAQGGPS